MRITVVAAQPGSWCLTALTELGGEPRYLSPLAAPQEYASGGELLVVDAGEDGALAGYVVRRVREANSELGVLVALSSSQLTRLDPSWGHDDFVVAPCPPGELYARVRALEWRRSAFAQPERIKVGALVLDLGSRQAQAAGRTLELARREFDLLAFLAREAGRVVRRSVLLEKVWGLRGGVETRSLDVHVRRLREHLGGTVLLETVRGVGYRLQAWSGPSER